MEQEALVSSRLSSWPILSVVFSEKD